jgi:hypothetical protein
MDKYEETRNWTPEQRRAAFRAAREAEARKREAEMQQCEWREPGSPCPVHDDPDEPHNCGVCRSCTLRVCVRCERREALPYPEGRHCGQYCLQCEADSVCDDEAWDTL